MKIRQGYVSNSSSSSFMIAVKGELTEERLLDAFGVGDDSPLYCFAKDVVKTITSCLDEDYTAETEKEFQQIHEWYFNRYSKEEYEDQFEQELKLLRDGYVLMGGDFSDDDRQSTESWLCYNGFKLETPDLIIDAEGGY